MLGRPGLWERWFALGGWRGSVNPVATFNDAGLLLQAVEQDIGIGLAREELALSLQSLLTPALDAPAP